MVSSAKIKNLMENYYTNLDQFYSQLNGIFYAENKILNDVTTYEQNKL